MKDLVRERLEHTLSDQYRIHRELGGGGMSHVFLATDLHIGRDVVVKTLPSDLLSADAVERFRREVRLAAKLQHPNIVPLLSTGESAGIPYYTMPWIGGDTLRERLRRGPIPRAEGIVLLRDIARALAAAHSRGVVHRDIKPENVLLTDGAAMVTDFGVARALSEVTTHAELERFRTGTGIAIGTPAYMAPEQFAADPSVDQRADLYAWGVVAYEVFTGQHPFAGLDGTALLQAHLSTVPARADSLVADFPPDIARIIAQCLEKDPALRPSSALDVVRVLEVPDAAPKKRPSRQPLALPAAAIAVVAIVAIGSILWSRRTVPGDDAMIAIAPFRVGGAAPDVHYLREGLPDLMTPQLHAIPGVKTLSMRTFLEQWRRAAGSIDVDLSEDRARQAAASGGAGQIIIGDIVGNRDRVTVNAQLVRVRDGKVLASGEVRDSPDSIASMGVRLVAALKTVSDGGTIDLVRAVVSAKPDAITPFLIGEQLYRRGRYRDAATSYARAFENDTTFGLAALRMHIVNGWTPMPAQPRAPIADFSVSSRHGERARSAGTPTAARFHRRFLSCREFDVPRVRGGFRASANRGTGSGQYVSRAVRGAVLRVRVRSHCAPRTSVAPDRLRAHEISVASHDTAGADYREHERQAQYGSSDTAGRGIVAGFGAPHEHDYRTHLADVGRRFGCRRSCSACACTMGRHNP